MNRVALIGRLTANPTTHAGADFVDIVTFDKLAVHAEAWPEPKGGR